MGLRKCAYNVYYLSRFKDSTRQGTIDLMLGNVVSEDIFTDGKGQNFEEDSAATAEHVKILIEDCKKMLINQPESVLGSWGLINADPSTGDPNETEMDSILILTKESYFVADYDDQVDKVTKFQRVSLDDITLLECGIPEISTSLFKTTKTSFCIRINYKVEGVSGYYHMFRSTNLRFFNNMAVIVKNEEEEIESLKSICDSFLVALEICGLPSVPFTCSKCLDRRKSKVINNGTRSGIYLDIVGLPQMTRNVSESQLLALKNVGSKAISNVTQQFRNKIGKTFKKNKQANFTIGNNTKNESSSDTDEDYENSIFQPNASLESGSLHFATDSSSNSGNRSNISIEQAEEATENTILNEEKLPDTFLPSVGIVMGNTNDTVEVTLEPKQNLLTREDSSHVDEIQLSSIMEKVMLQNPTPEIHVSSEGFDSKKQQPPNSLKLEKKLSHSSGEVADADLASKPDLVDSRFDKRYNSDYNVNLNISQSQSESALRNKLGNLSSPVTSVTKDLVFSPLTKFAKGVQNFGANLDPRKLGQVRQITEGEIEEHRKLKERWRGSKSRLIAL